MRKITVSLPEGLYLAARELAKKHGHTSKNSTGLSALCRGLLRARCSKEGYDTTYLDSDGERAVPVARKGIDITGEDDAAVVQRCPVCGLFYARGMGHYCMGGWTKVDAVNTREDNNA